MNLTKQQLRKLLDTVPGLDSAGELSFKYLSAGLTNENYWLQLNNEEYVLRLNHPYSEQLGLDRDAESRVLDKVSQIGLVAQTIYVSIEHQFRLTRWLEGRGWNKNDFAKMVNINRLSQTLKHLHDLDTHNLPQMDLLKRLAQYRTIINERSSRLPAIEQRLLAKAIHLINNIKHSLERCLCHNDLVAANILVMDQSQQNKIMFLDWEYAAVNAPLFELAVICRGNNLAIDSQHYLLSSYLETDAAPYIDEFNKWLWFYDYLALLWGLAVMPDDGELPAHIGSSFQHLYDTYPND